MPGRRARRVSRARRPRRRMRAGRAARAHLPADAGGRQAGDGAVLRRAAAAPELIDLAKAHGGRILVPTGALLGLDAVAAAAEGKINSVRMTTRKPPDGLAGAPYLVENDISVEGLNTAKLRVQRHRARGRRGISGQRQRRGRAVARRHRPRPHHDRHLGRPGGDAQLPAIEVDSDGARSRCRSRTCRRRIPKTGKNIALSVIAALRKMHSPLRSGT